MYVVRTCHLMGQFLDFVAGLPLLSMVSFTLFYVCIDLYLKKNLIFFEWGWVLKNAFVSLTMSNWK